MSRKYTKKSEYWSKLSSGNQDSSQPLENLIHGDQSSEPNFVGEPFYTHETRASDSDRNGGQLDTTLRRNLAYVGPKIYKYGNIREGILPFEASINGYNIRDAIELCQKAYANVAIFRNAIDIMSEFANAEIYLEGGTQKSKDFFRKWMKSVRMWNVKDQYFREYYRSGNVFFYKINAKFEIDDFQKILEAYANYDGHGQWARDGLNIQLDPTNIVYSFYKKQDYEPFSIPFGFPVLDDINFKMEMKKIDQAICRTIENVILLITVGTEPSKGGINHKNIKAMQGLLNNQSVGRVLVADYTTKAEFVIPDMQKVLGYEKYRIVNEDIKEGLQNILIGSEKFANTTVKAQVFFERLKESRNAFLNDFLQPEIEAIFKNLGFKGKCPVAKFEEVSIKDETQFNRVVTRMMELGILPPEQGLKVIESGIYPNEEELAAAQAKFVEDRKKGYYNPMVGGVPVIPDDSLQSNAAPNSKPNLTNRNPIPPKEKGRPMGAKASVLLQKQLSLDVKAYHGKKKLKQ